MKLSEHFTKEEFEKSQYARRHNIDNTMNPDELECAETLCREVLEKIRSHYDAPVIVSSGFRNKKVNQAIGGSSVSQHMKGEAADINVVGVRTLDLMDWIVDESGIEFDQCIYEFEDWVHISFTRRYKNRNQVLTINNKGTFTGVKL